jgi:hypothetical protein
MINSHGIKEQSALQKNTFKHQSQKGDQKEQCLFKVSSANDVTEFGTTLNTPSSLAL